MLESETRTRLVVSVPFSLAEYWLAPRLAALLATFPHMAIDIRVEDDPVDMIRQNIDLRISYGDYHYPEFFLVELVHDEVLPIVPRSSDKISSTARHFTFSRGPS